MFFFVYNPWCRRLSLRACASSFPRRQTAIAQRRRRRRRDIALIMSVLRRTQTCQANYSVCVCLCACVSRVGGGDDGGKGGGHTQFYPPNCTRTAHTPYIIRELMGVCSASVESFRALWLAGFGLKNASRMCAQLAG